MKYSNEILPDNYLEIKDNDKYHHSLKGCDIEVIVEVVNENVRVNKYCKTHQILCSKTGWELGWYMGTKSVIIEKAEYCLNCGCKIDRPMAHRIYCRKCKSTIASFRSFVYNNYYKKNLLYYNLEDISLQVLTRMRDTYVKKYGNKYKNILNYQIKNYENKCMLSRRLP